jgi:hypothetical protein
LQVDFGELTSISFYLRAVNFSELALLNLNHNTIISTPHLAALITMAQPASKKQKTNEEPPSPVVFQSPGLQPDVRLTVFDKEFHVHSVLLKLHSAFFRKFLDSPDKAKEATDPLVASPELLLQNSSTSGLRWWMTILKGKSITAGIWFLLLAKPR